MKTIAIVEDDKDIGNMLEELLRSEGYGVVRAYSGSEAVMLLDKNRPDLLLLDLMLPGMPGENVLQHATGIPVIVLSAKVGIEDKVINLMNGASDYMTKPFDNRELLARIAVQLRDATPSDGIFTNGQIQLNAKLFSVTVSDTPVRLTKTEFAILKLFLARPKQVFSKSQIVDAIGNDTEDGEESSINTHISNLRNKLLHPSGHNYIEAIWGIGYRFSPDNL